MKTIETIPDDQLDPGTALAEVYLPTQDTPFVITGEAESVVAAVQGLKAVTDHDIQAARQKPVRRPVEQPGVVYELPSRTARIATWIADARLRRFDKYWNTELLAAAREQRRKQAIFLMAAETGLFDPSSDYYKAQLNRLTKVA